MYRGRSTDVPLMSRPAGACGIAWPESTHPRPEADVPLAGVQRVPRPKANASNRQQAHLSSRPEG
jgi:hypothetical protein